MRQFRRYVGTCRRLGFCWWGVCRADGGWRLRISVVVYIGGSVAEVLGVGVQCAGVFIFLAFGKYAGLAPTF
jgi:hypothetical protein